MYHYQTKKGITTLKTPTQRLLDCFLARPQSPVPARSRSLIFKPSPGILVPQGVLGDAPRKSGGRRSGGLN